FCYVQWIAYQQWREIKSYAESRDTALMGDIPFGVSYHSADVFTRRDEFMLEWSGGAPPEPYFKDDAFTQKWGQNWGIPVYRWEKMRANNFAWWRGRVRAVRSIFHLFRIDHVLGFCCIYAFSWWLRRIITCSVFILTMPFQGGRGKTIISFRSIGIRCWNKPVTGRRISFRVTTRHQK